MYDIYVRYICKIHIIYTRQYFHVGISFSKLSNNRSKNRERH